MIGGDASVGTALHLTSFNPLVVHGPHQSQDRHGLPGEEDVVNDALEVEGVVGVAHGVVLVDPVKVEGVRDVPVGLRVGREVPQDLVVEVLEVGMPDGDFAHLKVLNNTCNTNKQHLIKKK